MRKRSSKGGGAQRSIQVHLMVNEEEAAMIRAAARKRNQTVSLTIIEAVKLLEGSLYVEEEEHDSPTVQALREIEYQLRRIGRNVPGSLPFCPQFAPLLSPVTSSEPNVSKGCGGPKRM